MENLEQLTDRIEGIILNMAEKGTLQLDLRWYLEHSFNEAAEIGKIELLEQDLKKTTSS